MNNNALIIMAKYPDQRSVKTRLRGFMSDEKRLQLYVFMLESMITKMKSIREVDTFVAYTPMSSDSYFAQFGLRKFPQSDGDLGMRMLSAVTKVLNEGYEKVLTVGVDIPDLSASIVSSAFELLNESDIVFGPARDGGYYLVGLKAPTDEIFRGVKWSTNLTLKQSVEKAERSGYRVSFTETLSDIDSIDDVRRSGKVPSIFKE
jgi:rSAM/selenodomain-associated transferase 1